MKKVIVSVINDLVTDQRVHRNCMTLHEMGFEVLLVGREQRKSQKLKQRVYQTHRMKLFFEKGFLFYAEFNFRLYLYLLLHKADALFSNDLDTLLPNFMTHKLKRIPLIFDSHEYFTETPELTNRPVVKKVWKSIEKIVLPKLLALITVNESIAQLFRKEYDLEVSVVRNIPIRNEPEVNLSKKDLDLPENIKLILIQGAGLNIDRGVEELVEAMVFVKNARLLIIGDGDVLPVVKQKIIDLDLSDKIILIPKQPFAKLQQYTKHADLGVSIDKDTNLNYKYSLPNKIFDYIHAGIPMLCSPLIEIKSIIEKYEIGECIKSHDPKHIAERITTILENEELLKKYKTNTLKAAEKLNWGFEKQKLMEAIKKHV